MFSKEYLELLFGTTNGINIIKYTVFLTLPYYLQMPFTSILQALNKNKLNFVLTYDITDRGNSLGYRLMSQLNGYEDRYEHHCGIEFNLSDKDVIAFVKGFPEYIKQRITIKDPHLFYERDERIRC